jgi:hypothetical protein
MKRQPFVLMTIASLLCPSHPPVSYRLNDEILTTIFESSSLSSVSHRVAFQEATRLCGTQEAKEAGCPSIAASSQFFFLKGEI